MGIFSIAVFSSYTILTEHSLIQHFVPTKFPHVSESSLLQFFLFFFFIFFLLQFLKKPKTSTESEEMGQRLGALVTLPKDPGLIPTMQKAAQKHL